MRKADIEVGKSYRADRNYPLYGAKVRVLEKNVPRLGQRKQPGIRVVVERSVGSTYFRAEVGREYVVASRVIAAPWTEVDDADADAREKYAARLDALRARIKDVEGIKPSGQGIWIGLDQANEFLDRAGVPR